MPAGLSDPTACCAFARLDLSNVRLNLSTRVTFAEFFHSAGCRSRGPQGAG